MNIIALLETLVNGLLETEENFLVTQEISMH